LTEILIDQNQTMLRVTQSRIKETKIHVGCKKLVTVLSSFPNVTETTQNATKTPLHKSATSVQKSKY